MSEYKIIAIKIGKRENDAANVQKILTEFGCNIKVRLGLHDVPSESCSPSGLIILEVVAEDSQIDNILSKLNNNDSVTAKLLKI